MATDKRQATPDILGDLMSAAPAGVAKPAASSLRIAEIRRDGGTQPRAGLDEAHVADMVQAIAEEVQLPPVDVVFDGTQYWLYDGFHRVEAHMRTGRYTVMAIIHQGTQVDAQWASYGVNRSHGLKRTNEDKKRAVLAALKHPNGASMSNVQIAKHCGVDESTVRVHRAYMELSSGIPKIETRTVERGGKTYEQKTANIGTSVAARLERSEGSRQPKRDDAAEDAWQPTRETKVADLDTWTGDPIVILPTAGRPMMEVLKTDDELAAEAEVADIASREAAADEAARQARDQDFQDRMSREAAARRDAEYARQAQAAVLTPDIDANAVTETAASARNTKIDFMMERLQKALDVLSDYEQVTGIYIHSSALRRVVSEMLAKLEGNKV
jgi:hypothetical protein